MLVVETWHARIIVTSTVLVIVGRLVNVILVGLARTAPAVVVRREEHCQTSLQQQTQHMHMPNAVDKAFVTIVPVIVPAIPVTPVEIVVKRNVRMIVMDMVNV